MYCTRTNYCGETVGTPSLYNTYVFTEEIQTWNGLNGQEL